MYDAASRRFRFTVYCAGLTILIAAIFQQTSFCLGTSKLLKQYGRQSWQSDTGLPQNTVHAVLQTRDGFLWLATEGGLVRFDGQEFRTFDATRTHELPGDTVNDLAEDAAGALWIATTSGLAKYERGRFASFTTAQGLPSDLVRSVRARADGAVLVSTSAGLALNVGERFATVGGTDSAATEAPMAQDAHGAVWIAEGQRVLSLSAEVKTASAAFTVADIGELQAIATGLPGEIWIGGRNGVALFRKGQRIEIPQANRLNVTALLTQPNGNVWIGTDSGLYRYAQGVLKRIGESSGIASGRVSRLYPDREGAVWVAFDLGVTRITRDQPDRMQAPLNVAGLQSIFEDREGNMWLGTDVGGITVLREQAFSTLTTQDGLSDDFIRAVFQDHAGTVWLGTNRGGLNRIVGGKISSLRAGNSPSASGLSSNVVLALAEAEGDLWIGTPDGLSRLHNAQLKLFTTVDGLPDDFVRSLYTDKDGSLWIGTRNGLSHYAHGAFTSYSQLDGLGSDLIGSILRGRDGKLWVGTLNGLSQFDGKEFKNFTVKDGLGGNAITAIVEDNDGTLWVAAHAAGLARYKAGAFAPIDSTKAGLPEEIDSALISPDANGQSGLWLGSPKGVYHVPLDSLNAFVEKRANKVRVDGFGVADGMRISECSSGGHPAAWRMSDGSLWFATLKGAASVQPGEVRESTVAPPSAIEDMIVDDRSVDWFTQNTIVPPGRDRITIHYAGLSFAAPQKVRFRYRLEGFDKEWIEAGVRRTAYYTNIPSGSYRFVVYASNGDGTWSAVPGEVSFTVRPHFYRTVWFYFLVGLAVLGIAYLIYQERVRSVESQYNAVLAERNRIAREVHDTPAQGYVGISVQLELVSRLLQGSKEAAAKQIENTKELVRSSLAEARSSIWNLRSPGAESETLPARLAATVEARRQQGVSGPAISFDVRGTFRPVDQRIEDETLRIGQEAIGNAFRHASASEVGVVLSYDTSWLKLSVTDDGKGFAQPLDGFVSSGHYGLQGMKERAEAVGATLVVKSEQGRGTRVEMSVRLGK